MIMTGACETISWARHPWHLVSLSPRKGMTSSLRWQRQVRWKRQKDKNDRKTNRQKLVPQKRNYLVHCQRLRLIETDSTHLQLPTLFVVQLKFRKKGEHKTGEKKWQDTFWANWLYVQLYWLDVDLNIQSNVLCGQHNLNKDFLPVQCSPKSASQYFTQVKAIELIMIWLARVKRDVVLLPCVMRQMYH